MEAQGMSYHWPAETDFAHVELDVLDRDCGVCGRRMYICDHRYRRVHTLEGPLQLVCKLNHCPDPNCGNHAQTKSPEMEPTIAPPQWAIGWDVFCWIGHRRFSRHWAVPQIRGELIDTYGIDLSESAIIKYIRRYQAMLAARQQDPEKLRQQYEAVDEIILTIDGLQPEKGHEALYVVRELTQKRVWFAVALISASDEEVQRLIATAKQWAQALGKTVKLWISDKQDAFLKGVEAEFPGVPHRYCANHFLRDLAKPVVEADSSAKVKMRKKVRGLRKIEKAILTRQRESAKTQITVKTSESSTLLPPEPTDACCPGDDPAAEAVLGYCAAVRGILNDDQGGPLHPPGLRMAEGLAEIRESIQRNLDAKKGGSQKSSWNV
jgi:MULE transposase domain